MWRVTGTADGMLGVLYIWGVPWALPCWALACLIMLAPPGWCCIADGGRAGLPAPWFEAEAAIGTLVIGTEVIGVPLRVGEAVIGVCCRTTGDICDGCDTCCICE